MGGRAIGIPDQELEEKGVDMPMWALTALWMGIQNQDEMPREKERES